MAMSGSPEPIDWGRLAQDLQTIRYATAEGHSEYGGSDLARRALERIVGSERLAETVDYYVSGRPGFELARSVLWMLRPWSAMLRCRTLFDSDSDTTRRRAAVELLRVVADRRVIPWVADFLADPDPEIQAWGIGIVDQLVFSNLVEEEDCSRVLDEAERHRDPRVREAAAQIRGQLKARYGRG